MTFAQIWTYWIAVPITLGAVVFVLATVVGYLMKVVRPKYPPRGQA